MTDGHDLIPAAPLQLEELDPSIAEYVLSSISENTKRAYRSDLRQFSDWGGTIPASDRLVARYLVDHATKYSIATLARRLVAIGEAHKFEGFLSPVSSQLVKLTFSGIRRKHGKPQRRVAAATKEVILAMIAGLEDDLRAQRDRALLLIGFAGAFRRSELVGIDCSDLRSVVEGVIVTLRRSKTDQESQGREIGIPYAKGEVCPVRALEAWLQVSKITEGPVFRPIDRQGQISASRLSAEAVAIIVKKHARATGLDPNEYSGHSLRAGLVTSAAASGLSFEQIRAQTGHTSDQMLRRYIRSHGLFRAVAHADLF